MIAQSNNNLEVVLTKRDVTTPAKALREKGLLPAVLYGKEINPVSLLISFDVFEKLYKEAGETTIINLTIEGDSQEHAVLIKDTQLNPITGKCLHVDFYQIKRGEKLHATIPLNFAGEPPAVKDFGGILITNKNEIEVECLPKDLPKEIVVDLSGLKEIDASIVIKDLKIPTGVEVLGELEESIVIVAPPAVEEEEKIVSEEEAVAGVETTEEKESDEKDMETDLDSDKKETQETSTQKDNKDK